MFPTMDFVLELPDGTLQEVPLTFLSTMARPTRSNGAGSTTQMVVFDSLGIPVTVRLSTVLESTTGGVTTYRWFATSPDNQQTTGVDTTVGTGLITFDNNGPIRRRDEFDRVHQPDGCRRRIRRCRSTWTFRR